LFNDVVSRRAHEVVADDVTLENGRGLEEISLASRHSQLVLPADGGVAHVGEGINFYLRLGALGTLWDMYLKCHCFLFQFYFLLDLMTVCNDKFTFVQLNL